MKKDLATESASQIFHNHCSYDWDNRATLLQPRKLPLMEDYLPVIRKLVVIGIWIYVGIQMVPAARMGERNAFLWYFLGLFAFYIPFLIIAFLPLVLMLMAQVNGIETSGIYHWVGFVAFCLGLSVGDTCLRRVKAVAATPKSVN
ncbi:MAG: hypothetical protein SFV81_26095 [Pirellulaceae bacterium]|nr:hypothetical protein [Pirellulaceae bacterium]